MNPPDFGPHLREKIRQRLRSNIEGTALGKIGYVVHIVEIRDEDISKGKIEDSTGQTTYKVKFQALVFRPFKNEVLDTIVTASHNYGFFCKAGPLQIFVSRHGMPDDLKNFDHENSAWISDDKKISIRAGVGVRLRLMNLKFDQNTISGVGTIKDDCKFLWQWKGLHLVLFSHVSNFRAYLPDLFPTRRFRTDFGGGGRLSASQRGTVIPLLFTSIPFFSSVKGFTTGQKKYQPCFPDSTSRRNLIIVQAVIEWPNSFASLHLCALTRGRTYPSTNEWTESKISGKHSPVAKAQVTNAIALLDVPQIWELDDIPRCCGRHKHHEPCAMHQPHGALRSVTTS